MAYILFKYVETLNRNCNKLKSSVANMNEMYSRRTCLPVCSFFLSFGSTPYVIYCLRQTLIVQASEALVNTEELVVMEWVIGTNVFQY